MVPLAFKGTNPAFKIINCISFAFFSIDYILRLSTADFKMQRGKKSFFLYPCTFMAIIDLICIFSYAHFMSESFRVLRVLRMITALRVFKFFRYSRFIALLGRVIKREKTPLLAVGTFAVAYIIITALAVFNAEPETFKDFFDAIYWATVSLTTIGYGDICPTTAAGKLIAMVSTFVGMAVIALPSAVITAGYLQEIDRNEDIENITETIDNTENV